jgi:hypothetical protein
MGTRNRFHTEDQQIVDAIVQNVATTAIWLPGFVHPYCGESFVIHNVTRRIVKKKKKFSDSLDFLTFMA